MRVTLYVCVCEALPLALAAHAGIERAFLACVSGAEFLRYNR